MDDMLRKKVHIDDSMEMTSTSTFSQDRNAGMVMNKTLRKTLLNYTIVKQFIIKKIADGIKEEIDHKKRSKIALPCTSSRENGNLRRRGRL